MKNYTIEFTETGAVSEGSFSCDTDAERWVETVLENAGHDAEEIVSGDWDADGQNEDGQSCERMLFWASDSDAQNDAGQRSICQLCVTR